LEKDYIYFILLTAKQSSDDVVEGLEAGADDFIAKPFVNEELRVRILRGQRILSLERNLRRQNTELAVLNRRMLDDLNNAAAIQQGLLPPKILETDKYTFHYSYQPCEQLAGDTLNIVPVDDRHVAFYLLDVSLQMGERGLSKSQPMGKGICREHPFPDQAFSARQAYRDLS